MSLKKYSADEYEKAVGRVMFPNYKRYHNLNKECNDFFQKLIWYCTLGNCENKKYKQHTDWEIEKN